MLFVIEESEEISQLQIELSRKNADVIYLEGALSESQGSGTMKNKKEFDRISAELRSVENDFSNLKFEVEEALDMLADAAEKM